MSLEEIAALPVGALCNGPTLLLCWGTVPLMRKQIQIVEDWGFEYKTAMMWHKVFRSGKTAMGTGYRVRSMIEPVFVATYRNPKHKAFPACSRASGETTARSRESSIAGRAEVPVAHVARRHLRALPTPGVGFLWRRTRQVPARAFGRGGGMNQIFPDALLRANQRLREEERSPEGADSRS